MDVPSTCLSESYLEEATSEEERCLNSLPVADLADERRTRNLYPRQTKPYSGFGASLATLMFRSV